MSSNWITDRLPTRGDCAAPHYCVYDAMGFIVHYTLIRDGDPWKPVPKCQPYLKPQRFRVTHSLEGEPIVMECETNTIWATAPTRDAAERIAAIYEEVMP